MSARDQSLASLIGVPADQRSSGRKPISVDVRVEGTGRTFAASTVDVSPDGALVWVTDEAFVTDEEACDMVRFSERVAQEFATSMRIHFAGDALVVDAEVVRVTRKGDERSPMLLACRFPEPIDDTEWLKIGLGPVGTRQGRQFAPPRTRKSDREEGPPGDAIERRQWLRVERILYAEVQGDYGTYKAYALNVSAGGVLFMITDAQFAPPSRPDQLVRFTKHLGFQFRDGMIFRFLGSDIAVDADVVHVSERMEGDEVLVTVGARFRRELTPAELEQLTGEAGAPEPSASTAEALAVRPGEARKTGILGLMEQAVRLRASDVHVKAGSPVRIRRGGELIDAEGGIVTEGEAHAMALEVMSPAVARVLAESHDVEFAYTIPGVGRYRCSVYAQRGTSCLAIRVIPEHIPTLEELGLPRVAQALADRPRGLVLVTGPARSGKSHTLAAMIGHVNRTRSCHVLTLEDPIEFVHRDVKAHVTQREIGRDCGTFADALRRALRQDPDVILVGEMRDAETAALVLSAAEAGHLVFATLPTASAAGAVDRIVDIVPRDQRARIRRQLADALQGIVAQVLVPRRDDQGLALGFEVLVANEAVRTLIRERKTPELHDLVRTGGPEGTVGLEQCLDDLVERRIITYETAVAAANVPGRIERAGRES